MSAKYIATVIMILLIFALSGCSNTGSDEVSGTVSKNTPVNNGGAVIQLGGDTYYVSKNLAYENHRENGALYRLKNGALYKLSDIGGTALWSDGKLLYVSSENVINRFDTVTGEMSIFAEGTINYLQDDTLFYSVNGKIYKRNLNSGEEITIASDISKKHVFFEAVIGDKLYYSESSSYSVTVRAYDMKTGKSKEVFTETPVFFDSEAQIIPTVTHLSACGNHLIYAIGNYQGSGNYYFGDMYRIKSDGSGRELLRVNDEDNTNLENDNIFTLDDRIFYSNYSERYGYDGGYYVMKSDMSDKRKLDTDIYSVIDAIDGFLYYQTRPGDIHRCRSDMTQDSLLVKAADLPNFRTADDYFRYKPDIIGDTVYFNASVWGYRSEGSWRDKFINSTFNKVGLDGTEFKTLASISSDFDG